MTGEPARRFVCGSCKYTQATWAPRCPSCLVLEGLRAVVVETVPMASVQSFQSAVEKQPPHSRLTLVRKQDPDLENPADELADVVGTSSMPVPLSDVSEEDFVRERSGIIPFDLVTGGGVVAGGVYVLGGEPGCGKSSLLMQVLDGLGMRCLIATGEETVSQASERARRINANSSRVLIVAETDLAAVIAHTRDSRVELLAIDSIQTLSSADFGGSAGTPGQVKECTKQLVRFAKDTNTAVVLIGHVTNEGALSGPATLRHLVDVVLSMEQGERFGGEERLLKCNGKNRFGSASTVGYLEMSPEGLLAREAPSGGESDPDLCPTCGKFRGRDTILPS